MKLLASLLIAISLAVGLTAASSAYLTDLSRSDDQLMGLTINEEVRVLALDGLTRNIVAKRGSMLDATHLEAMRAAHVAHVRVEEFSLRRWNERWVFLLALLGMAGGALLTRRAAARAFALQHGSDTSRDRRSPSDELTAIASIVEDLLATWSARGDAKVVLERLAVAIEEHGPAFVSGREMLVARMGLGGYAGLMGRFAAAERQLHRAWSAAADGVLEETYVCLGRAQVLLQETRAALAG